LPGWQKHKPTFRLGQITSIEGETCSVALDPAFSSARKKDTTAFLPINKSAGLTGVPADYMDCGMDAFQAGDRVLIGYKEQDPEQPRVIGFERMPKYCENWMLTTGDVRTLRVIRVQPPPEGSLSEAELGSKGQAGGFDAYIRIGCSSWIKLDFSYRGMDINRRGGYGKAELVSDINGDANHLIIIQEASSFSSEDGYWGGDVGHNIVASVVEVSIHRYFPRVQYAVAVVDQDTGRTALRMRYRHDIGDRFESNPVRLLLPKFSGWTQSLALWDYELNPPCPPAVFPPPLPEPEPEPEPE